MKKAAGKDLPPSYSLFNPGLLGRDDLVAHFIVRQPLLESLLADLRQPAPGHHLLVGQRGSGKTTLLQRLRYAIADDPELSQKWLALPFPEEQYNMARLSHLWVNCLDALSEALADAGRESEADRLDDQIESLPEAGEEEKRAGAAQNLLYRWMAQEKRGFVLLLDSADLLFERLKGQQWALRDVLTERQDLIFVGASSTPLLETQDYGAAFYDFFRVHELRGVDDAQMREVLIRLSEIHNTPQVTELAHREPGRIRALRLLTGGNLRTLMVLYEVLARDAGEGILSELEQVLDRQTPYYKSCLEALSTQLQQVFDALALNWDPLTAAALARKMGLETNLVSAGLNRLAEIGVAEKAPAPLGEKTFFQVSERFFNIWYLMRASRRTRRTLLWLVKYLGIAYNADERGHLARRYLKNGSRRERPELAFAYAQAVETPALRRALEHEGMRSLLRQGGKLNKLSDFLDLANEDADLRPHAERIETLHRIHQLIMDAKVDWTTKEREESWLNLGGSYMFSLADKLQIAENLSELSPSQISELSKTFTDEELKHHKICGEETGTALKDAIRNGDMYGPDDIEGSDAANYRLNVPLLPAVARLVCSADKRKTLTNNDLSIIRQGLSTVSGYISLWNNFGNLLCNQFGQYEDAEKVYRHAIELEPDDDEPWSNLGNLLFNLKRYEEAEVALRQAVKLKPDNAFHWNNLGNPLIRLKQYKEAEEAYRQAIQLDEKYAYPWNNLGNLLLELKQYESAENSYREAIRLDPTFTYSWTNLGKLLTDLKRHKEAEDTYRQAIKIEPNNADSWDSLGTFLNRHTNRYEEAESAYRQAIKIDDKFAHGRNNLAWLLYKQHRNITEAEEQAHEAYQIEPNNLYFVHTLATVLAARGKWDEAAPLAKRFIYEGEDSYHEKIWPEIVLFFREAVRGGQAAGAVRLLDESGQGERWRPLREALQAVAVNDRAHLLRVAPEVRQPAEELLPQLLPEGVELPDSTAQRRAAPKRPRRRLL